MFDLASRVPDVEVLLSMEVEELAGFVLEAAKNQIQTMGGYTHAGNAAGEAFGYPFGQTYSKHRQHEVRLAIAEAFTWLQAQGLLVPAPDHNGSNGFLVLSRKAATLKNNSEFSSYLASRRFPAEMIHERIRPRVWPLYLRGDFDMAMLAAMREVETAVREAAGFGSEKYGVNMMREAFKIGGKLHDQAQQAPEAEAVANLFAGAVGAYKNVGSHRSVDHVGAEEAAEIITLASQLLRIVATRKAQIDASDA